MNSSALLSLISDLYAQVVQLQQEIATLQEQARKTRPPDPPGTPTTTDPS